jgi:hypothetical protein
MKCADYTYRMGQKYLTVFEMKQLMNRKVKFFKSYIDTFIIQCKIDPCYEAE